YVFGRLTDTRRRAEAFVPPDHHVYPIDDTPQAKPASRAPWYLPLLALPLLPRPMDQRHRCRETTFASACWRQRHGLCDVGRTTSLVWQETPHRP
ncbi:hypothetical protein, partial [Streptomyces sp. NPDC006334]|uniref:hypothetical protein n=1 Tax=Streptomyces sp. NPDC006334 TaxID=3156754 RepID=UPI0033A6DCD5